MAQKFALIIGNSKYRDKTLSRLVTPDTDVQALVRVLQSPRIGAFDEVHQLVNARVAAVRVAVARFFSNRKRDDLLLLYFSGHGIRNDRGELYLALRDTDHALLSGTALPAAFLTEEMDRSRSRRQVLILDCCHSGAFSRGMKAAAGAAVGTATAFEGLGVGRVVLTATDATQYAWEGETITGQGENSVFTRHLIQGLETGAADADGDGRVTLDEWYDYAYERVIAETPRQTPGKWSYKQHGEIFIARNPLGARAATAVPHAPVEDLPPAPARRRFAVRGAAGTTSIAAVLLATALGAALYSKFFASGQPTPYQAALLAKKGMDSTRAEAQAAGAPTWADSLFMQGENLQSIADSSLVNQDFTGASEYFADAAGLFRRATSAARDSIEAAKKNFAALQEKVKKARAATVEAKNAAAAGGAGPQATASFSQAEKQMQQAATKMKTNSAESWAAALDLLLAARRGYEKSIAEARTLELLSRRADSSRTTMLQLKSRVPGTTDEKSRSQPWVRGSAAEQRGEQHAGERAYTAALQEFHDAAAFYRQAAEQICKRLQQQAELAQSAIAGDDEAVKDVAYGQAVQSRQRAEAALAEGKFHEAYSLYSRALGILVQLRDDLAEQRGRQLDLQRAVDALKSRFKSAVEGRDLAALRRLYSDFTPAEQKSWEQLFRDAQKITLEIGDLRAPQWQAETAVVEIVVDLRWTDMRNAERQPVKFRYTWHLREIGDQLVIGDFSRR